MDGLVEAMISRLSPRTRQGVAFALLLMAIGLGAAFVLYHLL